jgi:hypothetical protein
MRIPVIRDVHYERQEFANIVEKLIVFRSSEA